MQRWPVIKLPLVSMYVSPWEERMNRFRQRQGIGCRMSCKQGVRREEEETYALVEAIDQAFAAADLE